jgi:hypothetical protein
MDMSRTRLKGVLPMSLMPCFGPKQAFAEGIVLGRLLAGYGELEVALCGCLVAVEGILDIPIRKIFGKPGAERRIKIAGVALQSDFSSAGLVADLTQALDDMNWCREVRNQYSHCQWYWTARGLCFVNLETLAKTPTQILSVMGDRCPIDVVLLTTQEDYFFYVKECLMYLETAYCAWDRARSRGGATGPPSFVHPKPSKMARPLLHN